MAKSYLDKDGLLYFLQKLRPSSTPSMDGTASTGTSKRFAADDHVHPTDTSRAPLASPAFTGTPTAPTAAAGTNNTQIATTAFVANAVGSSSGGETNQNAFSNIKVGDTTIAADTTTDTFEIAAGTYITLTPSALNDKLTIGIDYSSMLQTYPTITQSTTQYIEFTDWGTDHHYAIANSAKGAANGVCPLDANGKVDASYLPSYVDDVIEAYPLVTTPYANDWLSLTAGGTPLTPETGKIYVLMAGDQISQNEYVYAGAQYRWGGSSYVKLNDGGISSITNSEIDTIVAS